MESLELAVRRDAGETALVSLRGELALPTASRLREVLVDLLRSGRTSIVLDLSDLTFIDSAGLGVLIGGLRRAQLHGGDLALAGARPRILHVLAVAGLSGAFRMLGKPPAPAVG